MIFFIFKCKWVYESELRYAKLWNDDEKNEVNLNIDQAT